MAKKSFSARIDEDIYEAIADYCEEENISQAQWLERIAKKFLAEGKPLPDPVDAKIELAIAPLRDELAQLRQQLGKAAA
jgi:hypothetical protein